MFLEKSLVRFRNNKPYLLKKILVTIGSLIAFIYFISNVNFITGIVLFLFVGIPLISKIKKQPSEGKGFFGKVKNFYKNLYKDYVIDTLPLHINCKEENIEIILHKAEIIKRKPTEENFLIQKKNIAGILLDDVDNEFLIMFQEASVKVNDMKQNLLRELIQYNSTICFEVEDKKQQEILLKELKQWEYPVELLSEIEDEEEETEDPELKETELKETEIKDVKTIEINNKEIMEES